ncbi:hypothetical protein ACFO6R_01730 [Eubacterium multiforme]|uniref:Membrane protein YvbJ n=1 Tax=Eubacterium multiforme TaxID=83339 RepID=A0ABT9URT1_9FIRM|nr:hypothetical protein [Eubacterium multiforme]MDQ0148529.1 putative membrane protein YvbJ [Eubacterium multiforme]
MDLKEGINKIKNNFLRKYNEVKNINKENYKYFFKSNIKILVIICIAVFLSLGYIVGNTRTTKDQVLKNLEIGLEKGKLSKLNDVIRVDNKKIPKDNLKPLAQYYKGKDSEVNNVINDLKENNSKSIFKLEEEKGLFFNKYYVELKTFNLSVISNFDEADITLNNKEKIKSGETLKNLIPGDYKVSGYIDNKYGKIKKEENITLMKNETVNLKLDGIVVTVDSNFKDATVFINGEDSGIKVSDFKDIGPMPSDGSIKLSIKKEFPWGEIAGTEEEVKEIPDIRLNLNISNEKLWSDVNTSIDKFYKSVFEALNDEDKNVITMATDEAKNKIYSVLEKNYFILKNKYDMVSLNIDKDKSKFEYKNGEYIGTIVCNVQYNTSKIFLGLGKQENTKKFLTRVVYKNGEWVINNVENFSL